MFGFLKKIFNKDPGPEKDDLVQEKWETTFSGSRSGENRFRLEKEGNYYSTVSTGGLELGLTRKNLFAWVLDEWYRYRDCIIEGEISFDAQNGYSSAGLLFRYADERNFYYILVSNKGYVRLTVVFNGNPIHLLPWMKLPEQIKNPFFFRLILHGTNISFFLEDEWVFEIDDESIDAGWIGFAGQNYQEKKSAVFRLSSMALNSVPIDVETAFYRWHEHVPIPPGHRVHFAEHLFLHQRYSAAVIQLKRAARETRFGPHEFLLLGESLFALELFDSALESVEKSLCGEDDFKDEERRREALLLRGNILYSLNRFLDARRGFEEAEDELKDVAAFWNLRGNVEISLGNLEQGEAFYARAVGLDEEIPVFHINRARTLERIGFKEPAVRAYTKACTLLFREGEYDEIKTIFPALRQLDPGNREIKAIEGKLLFHEASYEKAEEIFDFLIEGNTRDSSVYYLKGILLQAREDRSAALTFFQRALELEPDFDLALFRVAENLVRLGRTGRETDAALERAAAANPGDPWVFLLAAEYELERGESSSALEKILKVRELDPEMPEALLLQSRILQDLGREEEALNILSPEDDGTERAEYANQRGNVFAGVGRFHEAAEEYEKAVRLERENPVYAENCAAACIEIDMVLRAEELLVRLVGEAPSPRVYNLLGNAVRLKGEFSRAEAVYKEGLSLEPGNTDIKCNLADLYLERREFDKCRSLLSVPEGSSPEQPRIAKLLLRLRNETEEELRCSRCGRSWWVERDLPEQPALTFRGEPQDSSPAGKCPECGRIFCVGCGKEHLRDGRFICPRCDVPLKLSDKKLRFLVAKYAAEQ